MLEARYVDGILERHGPEAGAMLRVGISLKIFEKICLWSNIGSLRIAFIFLDDNEAAEIDEVFQDDLLTNVAMQNSTK